MTKKSLITTVATAAIAATALATIATHQYAKRQRTWFRNRMGDWPRLGLEGKAKP